MQLPDVIGIAGPARSGKDTLAQFLVQHHGYEKHAFADPLKELALALDPFVEHGARLSAVVDEFGWEFTKDAYPEARRILQFLGTDVVRRVRPDYWVDQMEQVLLDAWDDGRKIVVSDVRFDNEASLIRTYGGIVVGIHRPSWNLPESGHISEAPIRVDFTVDNTGTPEEMYRHFLDRMA